VTEKRENECRERGGGRKRRRQERGREESERGREERERGRERGKTEDRAEFFYQRTPFLHLRGPSRFCSLFLPLFFLSSHLLSLSALSEVLLLPKSLHTHVHTHDVVTNLRHRLEVLGLESLYAAIGEFDVVAASFIVVAQGKPHSAIQHRHGLQPVDLDLHAAVWTCLTPPWRRCRLDGSRRSRGRGRGRCSASSSSCVCVCVCVIG